MPGVTSGHPVFRSTIPDEIFSVSNGPEATHRDDSKLFENFRMQDIKWFNCYISNASRHYGDCDKSVLYRDWRFQGSR
ncbi:hypothetical protein CEXT_741011 [Caerostris extrusa]|uniref:Uncharacterized protein n=1 Tax=Caerostris extrusa TaxID=172846 RepID=A0AAV4T5Z8_CAEEX|nr:hypothetical protein CEXT_741011 [Caerostris extrusa]